MHCSFVDDHGQTDPLLGAKLLEHSRRFQQEESEGFGDFATLDASYERAHEEVRALVDELMADLHEETRNRIEIERDRIQRLYDNRARAARDRIRSCAGTLQRLVTSDQPLQRQAIPLWEANLERAQGELESLGQDKVRSLRNLAAAQVAQAEYRLLAAARIEVAPRSRNGGVSS